MDSKQMDLVQGLIDIKVAYNGDLGILQHKTQCNLHTVDRLAQSGVISVEVWKQARQQICDYFSYELSRRNPIEFIIG